MQRTVAIALVLLAGTGMTHAQDVGQMLLDSRPGSASEAAPYGVPSNWSWVAGAVVNSSLSHPAPYTHVNFWGAVFRGQSNTTPANTEVQIAQTSMWVLYNGSNTWVKIQGQTPPNLGGGTFTPTYNGGGPAPQLRHTSEGSFVVPAPGYIWHFWYGNSYQPCDDNIREMLVNSQVRLVLKNPSGTDDRSQADYLVHLGADMRDPSDPGCANNNYICPSFGVGKFFRVTTSWRNCLFHSMTQADIDGGVPLPPASIMATPGSVQVDVPRAVSCARAVLRSMGPTVDLRGRRLATAQSHGIRLSGSDVRVAVGEE